MRLGLVTTYIRKSDMLRDLTPQKFKKSECYQGFEDPLRKRKEVQNSGE